jgi:uncharacterized protein
MSPPISLSLAILPGRYAFVRLGPEAPVPPWAGGEFTCIARSADELSVVCLQDQVPRSGSLRIERDFRVLKVAGPLDFSLIGIIASLAQPLAAAGISIAPIATFDTDYVLVRERDLARAIEALAGAGHTVAE